MAHAGFRSLSLILVLSALLLAVMLWPQRPPTQAAEKKPPREITNSIGMKLVLIPAGKFIMGSPKTDRIREDEESEHKVEITRPFYMGIHEVTQKQYKMVMGKNPSYFSSDLSALGSDDVKGLDTDQFPVENLSWNDAKEFCEKLSAMEKKKGIERVYRLPSEAEWEFACRGGTSSSTPFHFGKALSARQANFDWKVGRTTKVGSYKKNAFGLYDMHGNVWEWCNDWYDEDYYHHSPKKDPQGPKNGSARVIRGGSWSSEGRNCRSAYRLGDEPGNRNLNHGFRVVFSAGAKTR
jgi:formylglycine-generating enzyme required for sulfatase activity